MTPIDQYKRERDAYLQSIHVDCRAAHAIAYTPFTQWCAARGLEPHTPDFGDPCVAKRFKAYQAWREGELARLGPEARARVEPHMTPFLDWLVSSEAEKTYPPPRRKRSK